MPNVVRRTSSATLLAYDVHPILRRIYAQRGVTDPRQLQQSVNLLHPCEALSGVDAAVGLLERALKEDETVLVVGDFDADGATSTALAVRALRAFGARHVHYLVPNRFRDGYGLTPEIVAAGAAMSSQLLITVDNGISGIEGVAAAHAQGMRVLITDHHLPGSRLPAADAIVNPNLIGDQFPSKCLAGVGVVLYLMIALRKRLRETGWYAPLGIPEPNLASWLDLVALGTVADVVPLDHNNRILVEQGLRRIRAGLCVPGIRAILRVADRDPERIVAADLGFAVGPRLNAAGRLADMRLGIECLLSDDEAQAAAFAQRLDELNRQRREIEGKMHAQALRILQAAGAELGQSSAAYGMCLFDPSWHQGVIGILAGRIKERMHRPVVVFADAGDGTLKGSARSIPGLHVRDVLETIATQNPGLVTRFGGHAMAAGLSLPVAHFPVFREAFDRVVRALVTPEQMNGVLYSDGELAEADFTLEVARILRKAGPWGQGFPEPVFDGLFDVISHSVIGARHLKLAVKPQGCDCVLQAMAFNAATPAWLPRTRALHMLYRLEENVYQGLARPQLTVSHMQPAPT
jgi:single-stranded-DNA-specific exonuclease